MLCSGFGLNLAPMSGDLARAGTCARKAAATAAFGGPSRAYIGVKFVNFVGFAA